MCCNTLEQGADKEKADNSGLTALMMAAILGYYEVLRYLVEQGADKEKANNNGLTALVMAADFDHLGLVQYLVEQGADKDEAIRLLSWLQPIMVTCGLCGTWWSKVLKRTGLPTMVRRL